MFAMNRLFFRNGSILLAIVVFLAGCAAGGSHFRRAVSASDTFENHRLVPEYSYYYSGHPSKPVAVIGLKRSQTGLLFLETGEPG